METRESGTTTPPPAAVTSPFTVSTAVPFVTYNLELLCSSWPVHTVYSDAPGARNVTSAVKFARICSTGCDCMQDVPSDQNDEKSWELV